MMKKIAKICAVVLPLAIAASALVACEKEGSKASSDPSSIAGSSDDWKQLYLNRLDEDDIQDIYMFGLADVNDDSVPELYIDRVTRAEGGSLLYISNGKLNEERIETSFAYAEKTGYFITEYGVNGLCSLTEYMLDNNGNLKKTAQGESNENEQLPQPVYQWNGVAVTKEEFNQNEEKLRLGKVAPQTCDKSEIIRQIENY